MVADLELQFSADPQKAIFAGEIHGSVFISGQHYWEETLLFLLWAF